MSDNCDFVPCFSHDIFENDLTFFFALVDAFARRPTDIQALDTLGKQVLCESTSTLPPYPICRTEKQSV